MQDSIKVSWRARFFSWWSDQILELNPFNASTGGCLFDWDSEKDEKIIREGPFQFRIATQPVIDKIKMELNKDWKQWIFDSAWRNFFYSTDAICFTSWFGWNLFAEQIHSSFYLDMLLYLLSCMNWTPTYLQNQCFVPNLLQKVVGPFLQQNSFGSVEDHSQGGVRTWDWTVQRNLKFHEKEFPGQLCTSSLENCTSHQFTVSLRPTERAAPIEHLATILLEWLLGARVIWHTGASTTTNSKWLMKPAIYYKEDSIRLSVFGTFQKRVQSYGPQMLSPHAALQSSFFNVLMDPTSPGASSTFWFAFWCFLQLHDWLWFTEENVTEPVIALAKFPILCHKLLYLSDSEVTFSPLLSRIEIDDKGAQL